MTIEVALLISIVSIAFNIYQGVANLKRNQKTDDRSEATQLTTVIVKLENIGSMITEINHKIDRVEKDTREDRERIVKLEAKMAMCLKYCKGQIGEGNINE